MGSKYKEEEEIAIKSLFPIIVVSSKARMAFLPSFLLKFHF